jgi:riboflavin synthase
MFTGLIETVGTIKSVKKGSKSLKLGIAPGCDDYSVSLGGSIAVSGVCLTVELLSGNVLFFTAVNETLENTTLTHIKVGDQVNLERAMCLSDRLDGHIVLGHVDGVGRIESDRKVGDSLLRTLWVPDSLRRFMAKKGSVAIDGISLTIAESKEGTITISLVPHTMSKTTMLNMRVGQEVNIECDIIARYIYRQLQGKNKTTGKSDLSSKQSDNNIISMLENNGF